MVFFQTIKRARITIRPLINNVDFTPAHSYLLENSIPPPLSFLPSFLPFLLLFFSPFILQTCTDAIVINIRDEIDEGCRWNIVPGETSPLPLSLSPV